MHKATTNAAGTTIVTPASLRSPGGAVGFRMPRVAAGGAQTFAQPRSGVRSRPSSGTFAFPMGASRGGAVSTGVLRSRAPRP